mmetsp:Transcript_84975/g.137783  ORF Transcript_84975/g.137783 Transcript_84975/m.137783 type:complete len:98 (+) Transcript_84975:138-431(+)
MAYEMEIRMLNGHHRSLLEKLISKERKTSTIQDPDFHSDKHFESSRFGNGLYRRRYIGSRGCEMLQYTCMHCNLWDIAAQQPTKYRVLGDATLVEDI